MKKKILITSLILITISLSSFAQHNANLLWKNTTKFALKGLEKVKRNDIPKSALTYHLDINSIKIALVNAPVRNHINKNSNTLVSFPVALGNTELFKVFEASVFHPDLATKYPEIKSYIGYGINNPTLTVRFSLSPYNGLSAMITGGNTPIFIEPYTSDFKTYLVFSRSSDEVRTNTFECLTDDIPYKKGNNKDANDQTLRTFRLAISATGEYTAYHGGTKSMALAAMNATMTRVNGVYETDFAITMVLIANTDDVIYTNAGTDPYGGNLNNELQSTLTSVIGEANYDVGHLFHQENK